MVVGRQFSSVITANLEEGGDWKVVVEMIEKRKLSGEDWAERRLSAQCTDKEYGKAYAVAMDSVLMQFSDKLKEMGSETLFEKEEE